MAPVGLEHALERYIVVRPPACLKAVELYVVDVPFMALIGSSIKFAHCPVVVLGRGFLCVIGRFLVGINLCCLWMIEG